MIKKSDKQSFIVLIKTGVDKMNEREETKRKNKDELCVQKEKRLT